MRIALHQGPAIGGDIEAGFARIERRLAASAAAGASMIVFPELFLPGYNQPELHRSLAQPLDGPWTERLSCLARAAGCGLTIGWAEAADGVVYNAATSFDASGGRLEHYRKIQLFGPMEAQSFAPGDAYATFDLAGRKAALLICYDVEFPQHCRALAEAGATLVLVPTANPAGFERVSRTLVPARAAEAGLTIVYANLCGREGDLSYGGQSLIVGPDAEPLASAGHGEALLVADLGPVDEIAAEHLSTQCRDYRPIASEDGS